MGSVPHPDLNEIPRVALYARVSTEDQAERQTVQGQLDFLRKLAELHGWPVAGEYVDDGVSGTVPLDQRTDGRRLLDDARIRRFEMVVFYRLDRLGRSIRVLLDAHQALEDSGILLKSATEPFDTASPIGKFVFALLGGMAELEKATIVERTTMGRDRVAKAGKWTGGPIPFGYDVDGEGCLVPSARLVLSLDTTEAELAADLYKRIAAGSTLVRECTRLTALGVPAATRYAGGGTARVCDQWRPSRLSKMLRNPVYKGEHVLRSRRGDVARPAPALVSAELWERVQKQLAHNRTMSVKPAGRTCSAGSLPARLVDSITAARRRPRTDAPTPITAATLSRRRAVLTQPSAVSAKRSRPTGSSRRFGTTAATGFSTRARLSPRPSRHSKRARSRTQG
jgi:site-specific DNA recombinase